jgi:hypothetical protein
MSAGENHAEWCLRGGVAHLTSSTGRAPHVGTPGVPGEVTPVGHPTWGPCGDWPCGGTGMARSPSTRSVKQEATGTGVVEHLSTSCRTAQGQGAHSRRRQMSRGKALCRGLPFGGAGRRWAPSRRLWMEDTRLKPIVRRWFRRMSGLFGCEETSIGVNLLAVILRATMEEG